MGTAHQVVIHHVGKVIGRHAVSLDQNLVIQFGIIDLNVTVHHIVKAGHTLGRDLLADDIGHTGSQLGVDLLLRQVTAVAVVMAHFAVGFLLLMQVVQAFLGAEAVVGFARFDQLLGILFEHAHALALDIGADGAADIRAFVPSQAGGAQRVVNNIGCALHQAALIGILNAQDKGAAVMAGLKISIQCGAQVAHMHIARGGRCKPGAYRISHGKITPTFVMM